MKPANYILVILIGSGIISLFAATGATARDGFVSSERINFTPGDPAAPGEMLVKFEPMLFDGDPVQVDGTVRTSQASVNEILARLQVKAMTRAFRNAESPLGDIYHLRFDSPVSLLNALEQMASESNVEWVEPNYYFSTSVTPNDEHLHLQWGLTKIQAQQAWDISQGNSNIIVAIIDTGVAYDHPDLADNIWHNSGEIPDNDLDDDGNGYTDDHIGWDFVTVTPGSYPQPHEDEDLYPPDNDPMDFQGHGTHCSGIASAVTDNATGVAGTAWNCSIMALRAGYKTADDQGSLRDTDCAAALEYAADNSAHVISMSWGATFNSNIIRIAIEYAQSKGCVLAAAAGNAGTSYPPYYPASYTGVIAVAASDKFDARPSWSNYGSWVDIAAPGKNIYSTYHDSQLPYSYDYMSGTSMATPFVAGVAGLLLSQNPALTADEVTQQLLDSADSITWSGGPNKRLNAYQALILGVMDVPTNLSAAAISSHQIDLTWNGIADEDGYKIQRKTGSESFQQIDTTATDVTNYSDIGLQQDTNYTYRVCAYSTSGGDSDWSNEASAATLPIEITINSPMSGDEVKGGSSYNITWQTTSDIIDHIHLLYSTNGIAYQDITASASDIGSYLWEPVPTIDSVSIQVKAIAKDASNDPLAEDVTDTFIIDSAYPETTASLDGITGENGWYRSDVTVTLSATDNLTGVEETKYKINDSVWEIYSVPFDVTGTTVYYYSEDGVGNVEAEESIEINIDRTAPETSVSLEGEEGNDDWYLSDVTVTLSATDDASGVKETKYKVNSDPWEIYTAPFDVAGSTISYYSEDDAGNAETIEYVQIEVDSVPPETSTSLEGDEGDGGWYVSNVIVTISAADDNSGVKRTEYKINDGSWQIYSGPFMVSGSTLHYRSEDNAGNVETEEQQQIQIDSSAPSGPVVTDDGAYTNSTTQLHASWSSNEPESDVVEYQYAVGATLGGIDVVGWTSNGTGAEVTVTGLTLTNGQAYYFSVKARNSPGMWSSVGNSDGIIVNPMPVVGDIPNVNFAEDGSNNDIDLDSYVSDLDNTDDQIAWTYTGNTAVGVDVNPATHQVVFTAALNWNGVETITFTATDPDDSSDSDTVVVTVSAVNDPPTVSNLAIEPVPPTVEDDLHALYVYHDVDDGTDSSQISWYKNGQYQLSYENLFTLPSSATSPGEEWYFAITPSDGMDIGDTRTSPSVIIGGGSQEIHLYAGWNLFSLPLSVSNTDLLTVLEPIDGLYSSVSTYDPDSGRWLCYMPGGPDFLNGLNTIEPGKGYWINMIAEGWLSITGEEIANTAVSLYSGQNLVGYNSTRIQAPEEAQLPAGYISIWTYNSATRAWLRYIPDGPGAVNDLTQLEPGKGYAIYATGSFIWSVSP